MRRYKPDMMTVLVILVAIGVITTTSIQAQEIRSNRSLYITQVPARCMDKSGSDASCMSDSNFMLGITDDSQHAVNKLWQPHRLSQGDIPAVTSLFVLQGRPCTESRRLTQAPISTHFPDFRIGSSRYLTVDFEMEDIARLQISGISLGFRGCW